MPPIQVQNWFSAPIKINNWRIDSEGFLRITMCVLREGVFDYLEIEYDPNGSATKKVAQYIPLAEISAPEALATLEGKPLICDEHKWRDADNAARDKLTKGACAGAPEIKENGLYIDGIIYDSVVADDIKCGRLVEVSAGYKSTFDEKSGEFNGLHYDAVQTHLEFNHIAILEAGRGRCGASVRIINTNDETISKEPIEMYSIRMKIANAMRTLKFTSEEEASAVEKALDEHTQHTAEQIKNIKNSKAKLEELVARLDERLKVANAKIAELSSPDAQASILNAALMQEKQERLILNSIKRKNAADDEEIENEDDETAEDVENADDKDKDKDDDESVRANENAFGASDAKDAKDAEKAENEDDEDEKTENEDDEEDDKTENEDDEAIDDKDEKTENAGQWRKSKFGNSKTLAARRVSIVRKVANANGMEIPADWKQAQYDAAFATLAMQAKRATPKKKAKTTNKLPAGGTTSRTSNSLASLRDRMLSPMKAFSKGK
jgi:hypothetical protein